MSYSSKNDLAVLAKSRLQIRAVNNPLRQRILAFIKDNKNRICVTDIYKKLRIEQSVASAQLRILRDAKMVVTKRDGKVIYYSVDVAAVKNLIDICQQLVK